jgi:hypothetical protein
MQASFRTIPEYSKVGRLNVINHYSILKQRMLSMLLETAEQHYGDLFNSNPEVFKNESLKYIAFYLGIIDTSLSRIRKKIIKK